MCLQSAPSDCPPPSNAAAVPGELTLEWFEDIHEIRPADISGWVCWRTVHPCGCHLHAICLARGPPEAVEGEMEATVLATVDLDRALSEFRVQSLFEPNTANRPR